MSQSPTWYATYHPATLEPLGYTPSAEAVAMVQAGTAVLDSTDQILWTPAPHPRIMGRLRSQLRQLNRKLRPPRVRRYDSETLTFIRTVRWQDAQRDEARGMGLFDRNALILWRPCPTQDLETLRARLAQRDPGFAQWQATGFYALAELVEDTPAHAVVLALECLTAALDRLNHGENPRVVLEHPPVDGVRTAVWDAFVKALTRVGDQDLQVIGLRPHIADGRTRGGSAVLGATADDLSSLHWMDPLPWVDRQEVERHRTPAFLAKTWGLPLRVVLEVARIVLTRDIVAATTPLDRWEQYRVKRACDMVQTLSEDLQSASEEVVSS
jgi:hypothetical protein